MTTDRALREEEKTPTASAMNREHNDVVVSRFGNEVTLKRFVRIDERHLELRPESRNREHKTIRIDLAKHILHIDGVAVGTLIGKLGSPRRGIQTVNPRTKAHPAMRSLADYAAGAAMGWNEDTLARMFIHDFPRAFHSLRPEKQRSVLDDAPPLTGTRWEVSSGEIATCAAVEYVQPPVRG